VIKRHHHYVLAIIFSLVFRFGRKDSAMNYKIEQKENGTFLIKVEMQRNGKSYRKQETFTGSKRNAERRGSEIVWALEDQAEADQQARTGSLTYFKQCIDFYASRNEIKGGDQSYFNRLKTDLGEKLIDEMPEALERFMNQLSRQITRKGTPYANGTKNRFQAWTRAILNYACDWGKIEKNPIKQIQKFKETPRDKSLSDDQATKLFKAINDHRPYLKPIVLYALQIPCRVSELTNASRFDVNLKDNYLRIRSGTTKNGNGINKPIPPNMDEYFRSIPIQCPWVFYREANGEFHQLKNFNKAWRFVCDIAELGDFRFHDLRHFSATNLHNGGMPIRQLMEIAGWKTDMMTTYHHQNGNFAGNVARSILADKPLCVGL